MPVKIWSLTSDDVLTNEVETSRSDSFRGERYRTDAEALDEEIDQMLDQATALASSVPDAKAGQQSFGRRWSLGRALADSNLSKSQYLEPDELNQLWLAVARKCRLGVRADGASEPGWRELIPNRKSDPQRIEHDVFSRGLWLQEQELEEARLTFGSSLSNANELHRRRPSSHIKMRNALHGWLLRHGETERGLLTATKNFETMAKALAKRWRGRGPGAAKQPVHYSQNELDEEVNRVLEPIALSILGH